MFSQITAENSQAVFEQISGASSILWKTASSYAGSLMAPPPSTTVSHGPYGKLVIVF